MSTRTKKSVKAVVTDLQAATPKQQKSKVQAQEEPKPEPAIMTETSNTFDSIISNEAQNEAKPDGPDEKPKEASTEPQAVALSNVFDKPISKDRLHELEGKFTQKMVAANQVAAEAIEVILTIRDERQYLADGYETFDSYMEDRWDHTRQWVEQMEKHLTMTRIMQEKLGIRPDEARKRLTVYDATILRPLKDDPAVLVEAIKEAEEKYKATGKKSPKTLKEVVQKWEGFKTLKAKLQPDEAVTPPNEMPEPLTPEEFKLLDQLRRGKHNYRSSSIGGKTLISLAKEKAEAETIPLALALDKVCEKEGSIPTDEQLLAEARGDSLKGLVAALVLRVKVWNAAEKLKGNEALKEAAKAEGELEDLKKELGKTPEQKEQERHAQEEKNQKEEKEEKRLAEERQERAKERQQENEIWQWFEDDLSLTQEEDPRKFCEVDSWQEEGYHADLLVRSAADCLADAVKRLPLLDGAMKPTTIKAAQKAILWANEVLSKIGG